MNHSWTIPETFMKHSWTIYQPFMKDSWTIHEIFMNNSWNIHEQFMKYSWTIHEIFMNNSWNIHEPFMNHSLFILVNNFYRSRNTYGQYITIIKEQPTSNNTNLKSIKKPFMTFLEWIMKHSWPFSYYNDHLWPFRDHSWTIQKKFINHSWPFSSISW
jgi:hypothetical protein